MGSPSLASPSMGSDPFLPFKKVPHFPSPPFPPFLFSRDEKRRDPWRRVSKSNGRGGGIYRTLCKNFYINVRKIATIKNNAWSLSRFNPWDFFLSFPTNFYFSFSSISTWVTKDFLLFFLSLPFSRGRFLEGLWRVMGSTRTLFFCAQISLLQQEYEMLIKDLGGRNVIILIFTRSCFSSSLDPPSSSRQKELGPLSSSSPLFFHFPLRDGGRGERRRDARWKLRTKPFSQKKRIRERRKINGGKNELSTHRTQGNIRFVDLREMSASESPMEKQFIPLPLSNSSYRFPCNTMFENVAKIIQQHIHCFCYFFVPTGLLFPFPTFSHHRHSF